MLTRCIFFYHCLLLWYAIKEENNIFWDEFALIFLLNQEKEMCTQFLLPRENIGTVSRLALLVFG